jgi:multimeric flavodoxin WrbA
MSNKTNMEKKKKVLGICGVQKKKEFSSSQYLLEQALKAAEEDGAETEMVRLVDFNILECKACGFCLSNRPCPLHGDPADEHRLLYEKCLEADAFIFSSPVYALSLPSIWKKWIDRCDVNLEDDLEYDHYNYDTVEIVKGKAFRGKVAGQIAVAAGIGHEMALASLMPAFTAVKLTLVANVGLSLIEYDSEPGIKDEKWSKNVEEAQFAIDMARAVGKRVYEAIGFSAFDVVRREEKTDKFPVTASEILQLPLKGLDGEEVIVGSLEKEYLILIASSQNTQALGAKWTKELGEIYSGNTEIGIAAVACIGQLPHFITRDFVAANIRINIGEQDIYFDWDLEFAHLCSIQVEKKPHILCIDKDRQRIIFSDSLDFTKENIHTLTEIINKHIFS